MPELQSAQNPEQIYLSPYSKQHYGWSGEDRRIMRINSSSVRGYKKLSCIKETDKTWSRMWVLITD